MNTAGRRSGDSHPNPSTAVWWDRWRPVLFAPLWSCPRPLPSTWSPKPCPTSPGPNLRSPAHSSSNVYLESTCSFHLPCHVPLLPLQDWSSNFSSRDMSLWSISDHQHPRSVTRIQQALNKYLFTSFFEHLLCVKNCIICWANSKEIKQTAHIS